jgi:NADH:ubiquinone oxidoreductase subunit
MCLKARAQKRDFCPQRGGVHPLEVRFHLGAPLELARSQYVPIPNLPVWHSCVASGPMGTLRHPSSSLRNPTAPFQSPHARKDGLDRREAAALAHAKHQARLTVSILSEIFSWWGGNTWGTRLTIWREGKFVAEDDYGNKYYEQVRGASPFGSPRRWVIYPKLSDGSQVPPEWFGWLHHTVKAPPTEENIKRRSWQKPHEMNHTGTSQAYRPPGSILTHERRPQVTGDYSAWSPDQ